MNTSTVTLPAEFDHASFESQLIAWLREGHSEDDILSQALHTWPTLPEGYTLATLHLLKRNKRPKTVDPLSDLHRIHRRRARHLQKVGKALEAEAAPVSMHNLYRGLLRDHEAACYKMIDLGKDEEAAAARREAKSKAKQIKKELAQGNLLRQQHRELEKELNQASHNHSKSSSRNGTLTTMSWLLGFIISMFLAGCSGSTRTAATFLYTVSKPANTLADCLASKAATDIGKHDGSRQRTPQLHATSAENHQALLQRTAHDLARSPGAARG